MQSLQAGDPQEVGPFEIKGRLGSGGMGRVFLGRSASGERVAVKVIHAVLGEETQFRQRFRREVEAAAQVDGGHAARIIASDPDADPPWMAVEYIDGPTLQARIEEDGALPTSEVIAIAIGIVQALTAIHAAGIVHRDLKPTNVLLSTHGPRVIDFGIARAADSSTLTRTGVIAGTAGFMSPEQAVAEQVTTASDVFSLGAMLYFAATGSRMFGEGSTPSVMYRVVHAEPDLAQVDDPALRDLIGWCTSKDPAQRPTPSEILAAAPGVLDGTWRRTVLGSHSALTEIRVVTTPSEPAQVSSQPANSWFRRPAMLLLLAALIVLGVGIPGTVYAMNAASSTAASSRITPSSPKTSGAPMPTATSESTPSPAAPTESTPATTRTPSVRTSPKPIKAPFPAANPSITKSNDTQTKRKPNPSTAKPSASKPPATKKTPQDAKGCSATQTIPGVSVYYNYCAFLIVGDAKWNSTSHIQSHAGAPVQIDSQMTLSVDGKEVITKNWTFTTSSSTWIDPYHLTVKQRISSACTEGHRYFPAVRLRVHGSSSWGAWAGAHEFVCS